MKKIINLIVMVLIITAIFSGCSLEKSKNMTNATEKTTISDAVEETTKERIYYNIGDTVSTEIVDFTLDRAELAIALNDDINDFSHYFLPKEYDPKEVNPNSIIASKGHTFAFIEFTVKNNDRNSITVNRFKSSNINFISAKYKNAIGSTVTYGSRNNGSGFEFSSSDVFLQVGEECTYRCYVDIPIESENLNDEFELTFNIPEIYDEVKEITYLINS